MICGIVLASVKTSGSVELSNVLRALTDSRVQEAVVITPERGDWLVSGSNGVEGSVLPVSEIRDAMAGIKEIELHGVVICSLNESSARRDHIIDLLQSFWKSDVKAVFTQKDSQTVFPIVVEASALRELCKRTEDISLNELSLLYAKSSAICEYH